MVFLFIFLLANIIKENQLVMFLESQINNPERTGSIEVICGSMFSGKTEELLRRVKRAQISKLNTIILKPKIDSRYNEKNVVSHNKNKLSSTPIEHSEDILKLVKDVDVVGIDEAQFIDKGLVKICDQLANEGKRIIIAGLDMDYLGNPFGVIPHLLAIAENILKLHAICIDCGNIANYTFRKSSDDKLIKIGECESYKALCRKCFLTNNIY